MVALPGLYKSQLSRIILPCVFSHTFSYYSILRPTECHLAFIKYLSLCQVMFASSESQVHKKIVMLKPSQRRLTIWLVVNSLISCLQIFFEFSFNGLNPTQIL